MVQIKQKRVPGVETQPARSFWCGLAADFPHEGAA